MVPSMLLACIVVAMPADSSAQEKTEHAVVNRQHRSVAVLIGDLDNEDARVRWDAVVDLGEIGQLAVAALIRTLHDGSVESRRGAACVLGRIGSAADSAIGALSRALGDSDRRVRENAARALGMIGIGAKMAVPALVEALADSEPYVRGAVAGSLSRMGSEAIPALTKALFHRNAWCRFSAAIALGKCGAAAEPALPALVSAMQDTADNVRWASTVALGRLGEHDGSAIPVLLGALADRDSDVRAAARSALERIAPGLRTDRKTAVAVMDTLVPRLMGELHVPGVSIVMIQDREIFWSRSYGYADVSKGTPVENGTLFEACSMSKPVFAYIVMKLVEEGKLALDVPLSHYFQKPLVDPDLAPITARMALSHTTGLPNWRKAEEELEGPLEVSFAPGTRFSYSGEGIFYLQRAVEEIIGEPLDVVSERLLFRPMGLSHCSYTWKRKLDGQIAAGHDSQGKFLQKTAYDHPNAAYSLYVSAEDYARLVLELLRNERSSYSIQPSLVDTMLAHHVQLDSRDPIERPGKARGQAVYWGLGWSINATADGDIAHHGGSNRSGFRCFSQFNRSRGSGIVIMTNGTNGSDLWSRLISRVGDL